VLFRDWGRKNHLSYYVKVLECGEDRREEEEVYAREMLPEMLKCEEWGRGGGGGRGKREGRRNVPDLEELRQRTNISITHYCEHACKLS
jgi:hypothetical protein